MSRVSSLVMVRVAALVAFLTTRSLADLRLLVSLPETLSLTQVPSMAARVDVIAVRMALKTLLMMPGFFFSSFSAFSAFLGVSGASVSSGTSWDASFISCS